MSEQESTSGSARERVLMSVRLDIAVRALEVAGLAFSDPGKAVELFRDLERDRVILAGMEARHDELFFSLFESCAKAYE